MATSATLCLPMEVVRPLTRLVWVVESTAPTCRRPGTSASATVLLLSLPSRLVHPIELTAVRLDSTGRAPPSTLVPYPLARKAKRVERSFVERSAVVATAPLAAAGAAAAGPPPDAASAGGAANARPAARAPAARPAPQLRAR